MKIGVQGASPGGVRGRAPRSEKWTNLRRFFVEFGYNFDVTYHCSRSYNNSSVCSLYSSTLLHDKVGQQLDCRYNLDTCQYRIFLSSSLNHTNQERSQHGTRATCTEKQKTPPKARSRPWQLALARRDLSSKRAHTTSEVSTSKECASGDRVQGGGGPPP